MVQAATKVKTSSGYIILILHQAAYMPDGRTILSTGQMESFGCLVNDKPKVITGLIPFIQLPQGLRIPITIRKGLPYVDFHKYTDDEFKVLPKLELTSPHPWNPHSIDSTVPPDWYSIPEKKLQRLNRDFPFDIYGNLKEDPTPVDEECDEDADDRTGKELTRKQIRAYFHDLLRDEIEEDIDVFETIITEYGEYDIPVASPIEAFPTHQNRPSQRSNLQGPPRTSPSLTLQALR